ncbi:Glyoxalase/Bleomycin resistance protein/Dihydroxybiphenyl dioxygenase [Xylogone sp. PMI_703]|nr:Glyoxalase/Bleomycin resistance protein/Dihydroxybiphenyl dioxygenase [Xylogone sp. PMI_703]
MMPSHTAVLFLFFFIFASCLSAASTSTTTDFTFSHVGLSVADLAVETQFYRDVMGFNQVVSNYTVQEPELTHITHLRNENGFLLELINNPKSTRVENITNPVEGSRFQGYFHLALTVVDLDATFDYLSQPGTGASVISTPATDTSPDNAGGRFAYFADPEGNLMELIQLVAPAHRYFEKTPPSY